MGKKTKSVALGGIAAALTFVLCWVASVSMSMKFLIPMLCGVFLVVILRQVSWKVALSVYGVSSALLLLLPNKTSTFAYMLLLGYYPILCEWLKKLPVWLQLAIKLALLTAVGCAILFAGAALLGLWENEKFLQVYKLLIVAYYVMAACYDMLLGYLRRRLDGGWDEKLRKLFR